MIYLKEFDSHSSYESELNVGGVDFKIPNVSYCKDVKDVHFNPYNLIKFYVGNITGTTPQTVKIYTGKTNHVDVQVSEGNKWYSYLLPKNKELYTITENEELSYDGDIITKVIVKANISYNYDEDKYQGIVPLGITEASFKGSNTSNVTDMNAMFDGCRALTSLDVSNFDTSKVTNMYGMFAICASLKSLDVSNFDTSKVTYMHTMFSDCSGLISLDLSNFDTINVTNMNTMFDGCRALTSLDLSGWDMSKVTNMYNMFNGCSVLNKIKMIGCEQPTIDKIKAQLTDDGIINNVTIVTGQTI